MEFNPFLAPGAVYIYTRALAAGLTQTKSIGLHQRKLDIAYALAIPLIFHQVVMLNENKGIKAIALQHIYPLPLKGMFKESIPGRSCKSEELLLLVGSEIVHQGITDLSAGDERPVIAEDINSHAEGIDGRWDGNIVRIDVNG